MGTLALTLMAILCAAVIYLLARDFQRTLGFAFVTHRGIRSAQRGIRERRPTCSQARSLIQVLGREKQEVFPAAPMDGFTAARHMNKRPRVRARTSFILPLSPSSNAYIVVPRAYERGSFVRGNTLGHGRSHPHRSVMVLSPQCAIRKS